MNTDIRIDVGFLDHWKTDVLISQCGSDGVLSLMRLWVFAAQNKPDGRLAGIPDSMIERIAKWRGQPGLFLSCIGEVRFIERDEGGVWWLHDWEDHNPYAAHAEWRRERAKAGAAGRWGKKDDATSMLQASDKHASEMLHAETSDAPSPAPAPTPAPDPLEAADRLSPSSNDARGVNGTKTKIPECPHQDIIAMYHEMLPELPAVAVWTKDRRRLLQSRWREHPRMDFWRNFFAGIRESKFLMGKGKRARDGPPFKADLEWLLNEGNFAKVFEGKYDDD